MGRGEGGRELQDVPALRFQLLPPAGAAYDDVRPRQFVGMEPEVVPPGLLEGDEAVAPRRQPHEDGQPVPLVDQMGGEPLLLPPLPLWGRSPPAHPLRGQPLLDVPDGLLERLGVVDGLQEVPLFGELLDGVLQLRDAPPDRLGVRLCLAVSPEVAVGVVRGGKTGVERDLEGIALPVGQGYGLRARRDVPEVRQEQLPPAPQHLGLGAVPQLLPKAVPVAFPRLCGPPQADVQLAEAALPAPREQRTDDARRRRRERVGPQGLRLREEDGEAREVPPGGALAGEDGVGARVPDGEEPGLGGPFLPVGPDELRQGASDAGDVRGAVAVQGGEVLGERAGEGRGGDVGMAGEERPVGVPVRGLVTRQLLDTAVRVEEDEVPQGFRGLEDQEVAYLGPGRHAAADLELQDSVMVDLPGGGEVPLDEAAPKRLDEGRPGRCALPQRRDRAAVGQAAASGSGAPREQEPQVVVAKFQGDPGVPALGLVDAPRQPAGQGGPKPADELGAQRHGRGASGPSRSGDSSCKRGSFILCLRP